MRIVDVTTRGATKLDDRAAELLARFDGAEVDLVDLLCDGHDPSKVAFTFVKPGLSAEDVTYGELAERSRHSAAALVEHGVGPGDRVATLMGKSSDYVATVLGIWRAGAVHVPLFTAFAPPAIEMRLRGSDATVVVCTPDQRAKVDEISGGHADIPWQVLEPHDLRTAVSDPPADVSRSGETEFVRLFTSGTTGDPKGVPIPVRAIGSFVVYLEYGLHVTEDDVYWNAADPGWAYGLYYAIIAPLAAGRRSVLLEAGFSAEVTWQVLTRHRVTNFAAAPTVFRALRAAGEVPAGLTLNQATSAGEPLNPEMVTWATRHLGCAIHDTYGQTELGMCVGNGWHSAISGRVKPGSMGRALPGWRIAILDETDAPVAPGELGRVAVDRAHSPSMWFTGYVDAPAKSGERFSADGRWYFTGDVGVMDEEGYVVFSSRDDDVIIMAGYRIGPFEVESVLLEDPAVAEAAVVGAPDELRGEVVVAYVVAAPNAPSQENLAESLKRRVKDRLSAHAYPRVIHFVDTLPKTPSGKVQRFLLRERHREQ